MAATATSTLSKRFKAWIEALAGALVPPFLDFRELKDVLLGSVKTELQVDAASLFLINEDFPNQLECVAGIGYRSHYEDHVYTTDESALTPYVFRTKQLRNMSAAMIDKELAKIEKGQDGIPCSRRCKDYIETAQFLNVLAAPVVFGNDPLGVLKLENKEGTTRKKQFPKEDEGVAQLLAQLIGILHQQRLYTELWTKAKEASKNCRDIKEYLNRMAYIVARAVNAECCCIFLQESDQSTGAERLKYTGGVGYVVEYENKVYPLPRSNEDAASTTAHIAKHRITGLRRTEKQLATGKLPYERDCRQFFASGKFSNVLGMALLESKDSVGKANSHCWGVLRVDNKRPDGTEFGPRDAAVCKAFATELIVPYLKRDQENGSRKPERGAGLAILKRQFGEVPAMDRPGWEQRVKDVLQFSASRKEITTKDCWEYLGFSSRAAYYRHDLVKTFNQEKKRA